MLILESFSHSSHLISMTRLKSSKVNPSLNRALIYFCVALDVDLKFFPVFLFK